MDNVKQLVEQIMNDDWYVEIGGRKVCKCCGAAIREEYSLVFHVPLYFCTHTKDCVYTQGKRQAHG